MKPETEQGASDNTPGEWTAESVSRMLGFRPHLNFKAVADAHNAALAAERWVTQQLQAANKFCEELQQQLDLEKRQCAFESEHREKYRTRCGELTKQLAAIAAAQQPLVDALEAMFQTHVSQCEQCSGPDDGCDEGQRLEGIKLNAIKNET